MSSRDIEMIFEAEKAGFEKEAMHKYFVSTLEPEIFRALVAFKDTLGIKGTNLPHLIEKPGDESNPEAYTFQVQFTVPQNCDAKRLETLKKMIINSIVEDKVTNFKLIKIDDDGEEKRKFFQFGRGANTLH